MDKMKFPRSTILSFTLFIVAGFSGYWIAESSDKKDLATGKLPEAERQASKIRTIHDEKEPEARNRKFGKNDYARLARKIKNGMTTREYEEEYARLQEYRPFPYDEVGFLMESWASKYPVEAVEYLERDSSKSREERTRAIYAFMHFWGQQSPSAVYDYYMENKSHLPPYSVMSAINNWAERDPAAAWKGIAAMEPAIQVKALECFFQGLKKGYPQEITEYAGKLAVENFSGDYQEKFLLQRVAMSWMDTNPEEAKKWMASLSPDIQNVTKDEWFLYAARNNLPIDAEEREALVKSFALGNLSFTLTAFSDPMATMQWLTDNGVVKEDAVQLDSYISNWKDRNAREVKSWINGLPAGSMRDDAIGNLSRDPVPFEYESQIDLAMTMGDEMKKKVALKSIAQSWYRESPEEAKDWLGQSMFSSKEKEDIMKKEETYNYSTTSFGRIE